MEKYNSMHSDRFSFVFLAVALTSLIPSRGFSQQPAETFAPTEQPSSTAPTAPAEPAVPPPATPDVITTAAPAPAVAEPPAPPAAAPEPKKEFAISGEAGKGITVTTPDEHFSLTTRARIQARATFTDTRGDYTELINVKTLRVYFQGHVFSKDLKYVIQLAFGSGDFEAGSSSPIFDAYFESSHIRDFNLRIGQYFVQFDRARTVREFALQLADRPVLIPELTLDRDVGITAYSNDLFGLGGKLGYALGVFGGDGRNRVAQSRPGLLYVLRLAVFPFGQFDDNVEGDTERKPNPRLAIGIAGAYNQHTDRPRSTTGVPYVLKDGNYGRGFNYIHGAADLVFKWAGFSLLSEIVVRKAHRDSRTGPNPDKTKEGDLTEWSRESWGYLVQAGMMLTDHVEVAGRWGQFKALGKTDPDLEKLIAQAGHEATFGVNYYFNHHFFKIQADAGVRWGKWSDPRDHVARLQIDAMF
jgi:hypothetical protein